MKKTESLNKYGEKASYLFYAFIKWIIDDCQQNKIKKIYFFTREGEFFYEIAENIKHQGISLEILEVSRIATFFPSLSEINLENMMRLWNQYSIQSLKSMFKSLSVDVKNYEQYLKTYKIDSNEKIVYPWLDERVIKLFNDKNFIKDITKERDAKRELIMNYFKSKNLGLVKEDIAIVDIGWRGTIQDNVCYLLPDNKIYGYYFGLIDFLNKQPSNCIKKGFLNQFQGGAKYISNVTPFEMICNSPNGSTIGYEGGKNPKAIRKIEDSENASYDNCIKYIQSGVIKGIKNIKDEQVSYQKAFQILSKLVYKPNKYISEAYFKLVHNEEFGLGEYVSKNTKIKYSKFLKMFISSSTRQEVRKFLMETTWPDGYLKYRKLGLFNNYFYYKNYKKKDWSYMKNIDTNKKRIAWIIPKPIKGSGGHRTIIQNANYLVTKGYICDLYIEEDFVTTPKQLKNKIIKYFGECLCGVYVGAVLRKKYDLVFATHAIYTADAAMASSCKNWGYFIQDFEPWFLPMGETYISMENTYRYNFKCVSIGRWLPHKLNTEFGREVKYFPFCADLNVYKPLDNVEKENAICFIFQPEKPRRCSNLGLMALNIVKKLRPDIKIYLYGGTADFKDFECENLKIIPIQKCNELYNKCKVGLCLSASNPSRIPFEMMASGLPVVDLYRENNLYDMPSEGILLADSTPESIATALIKLIDDDKLNKKMGEFGKKFMLDYPIERGFEDFLQAVDEMLSPNYKMTEKVDRIYKNSVLPISDEVEDIAHIVRIKPFYKDTSDFVRNIVRIKKGVIRRIKRVFRR